MPVYSDSHAHLTDERFDADRDAVLERARRAGLRWIVTVATRIDDLSGPAALAAAQPDVRAVLGVHPHEAKHWGVATARAVEAAARRPGTVALGEIGLDYHYNHSPPQEQRAAFREQIVLARTIGLPIVVHTREAWADTTLTTDPNIRTFGIQLTRVVSTPKIPEWEEISIRLQDQMELALLGSAPPESAMASLDREVGRILEKRRWLLARERRRGSHVAAETP